MGQAIPIPDVDVETVRCEIRDEYAEVASNPQRGFHFHTGRPLAKLLGYDDALLDAVPEGAVESFAGTGNPFSLGEIQEGENVVDVGSGAGIDSLIAGRLVGASGRVIGVDMTPEMLAKATKAAADAALHHVEFRQGYAETLPVPDGWADVIISNGVVNLCPDKLAVFREMYRALRPGGRLQIGDIIVQKAVPEEAKRDPNLWKG
ncbi:MAG: methyltransferase domain-containing protein [Gemmatimonadota bacterium]|nr:methyltransferase domain-containing protein [Candidatus Palauibacterales bacterium]